MNTITLKTKKYIISIIISLVILLAILLIMTIYSINMNLISTFNFSHVLFIIIIILIFAYSISIIIKRLKKNEIEKQFMAKYFHKYEETKDIFKYSCLSEKEKKTAYKHIQTLFINIQKQESENSNIEIFNPKKYATNYIASIGYKSSIPLIINIMDSLFMSSIILILMQLLNLLIANPDVGFYEVTLLPFNVLFVFTVCFFALHLHRYLLKNNKPFVAGLVPFIFAVVYACLLFGLNSLFFNGLIDGKFVNYIISGKIMFIRTTLRLIVFLVGLALYFILKIILRKSCTKK